jgi:hypothetical protein
VLSFDNREDWKFSIRDGETVKRLMPLGLPKSVHWRCEFAGGVETGIADNCPLNIGYVDLVTLAKRRPGWEETFC